MAKPDSPPARVPRSRKLPPSRFVFLRDIRYYHIHRHVFHTNPITSIEYRCELHLRWARSAVGFIVCVRAAGNSQQGSTVADLVAFDLS